MIKVQDFWAPWCAPCKRMAPIIEELEQEMPDVEFEKINTDEVENRAKVQEHGVMGLPTFIVYRDGIEVTRKSGLQSKEDLKTLITG